ncbi:unnamed protein product, partial [Strongylus vulgaris]
RQATPTKVETENESKRKVPARTRRSTNQSEVRNIKTKKEEPENASEEHFEERKQCKNRRATPVHHPPRRRTNELELLLSSGKHDKSKDKEKEKEREKELAVLNTPTVSMRMLPASEDSPEDRCLYCQVSFKEKERSVSTPQYCSTKCRRSYQSMMATETMKRISGGSEVRPKFEEEVTPPSSSKGSKSEDSSHSKKPFSAFIDASRTATPGPPRGVVSPTAVQPTTIRASMSSPSTNDHSPILEHAVGVVTPVTASYGPLSVPGVDYDIDPKLWPPDVAARWAQAVTGSETCAATFRREEVDGDAMLMMGFDDLRSHLAFTFGPAKKLQLAIEQLKVFREQMYGRP